MKKNLIELVENAIEKAFEIDVSEIDFEARDEYGLKINHKNSAIFVSEFIDENDDYNFAVIVGLLPKSKKCKIEIHACEKVATIPHPYFENTMMYDCKDKIYRFEKTQIKKYLQKVSNFLQAF